jgi:hypothetical protein
MRVKLIREFVISVASGFAVAILSAIFLRRPLRGNHAPSQSMSMGSSSGGTMSQIVLIFLLGAAAAFAILMYLQGRIPSSF